jgi:hypothetical protein
LIIWIDMFLLTTQLTWESLRRTWAFNSSYFSYWHPRILISKQTLSWIWPQLVSSSGCK